MRARRNERQPVSSVRLERKVAVGYVALSEGEGLRSAWSPLVRAPGLAEANGLPEDTEAAELRVDLDADGRLLGVEVLWPPAQLPRALTLAGSGDRTLEARREESGAIHVTLDPDAAVAARAPVRRAAGAIPPMLAFDGEGRLVAIEVPEPDVQLRPELPRRIRHEQAVPDAVLAAVEDVLWLARDFEAPLARTLGEGGWTAEALIAAPVPPERLLRVREGGLPGGAIPAEAIVARIERELRDDPWAMVVAISALSKPGDGHLAHETVPHEAVGDTIVYATAGRRRAAVESVWRAASGPGQVALLTRHAPDGEADGAVAAATLVLMQVYDGEGLLLLRRAEPASLDPLDALWAPHRVELRRDHVGLWELGGAVRHAFPDAGAAEVRDRALALLARGLADPGVAAGTFTPKTFGFVPWDGTRAQVVERARRGWDALGRPPGPGEILWLTVTAAPAPTARPRP